MLLRPLHVFPVLLLLAVTSVEPFIILNTGTAATAAATTGTATTTGTVGSVGTLGSLGTLTLGTTTLGTGLASLGVLGALKLGVIAIAAKIAALAGFALAKKLHYKEPTNEYNSYSEYGGSGYGHHYVPVYSSGYGGGGGYGGGYGTSHYHKRSVDDQEQVESESESIVLGEEEAFSLVHESDESRCGERLVCELARRRAKQGLLSDEQSILSLIQQKPTGPHYGSKDSSRRLYLNALRAGYRRRSCRVLYSSCPFNSDQMMALVRSMGRDLVQDSVNFLGSKPDQQTLHPGQVLEDADTATPKHGVRSEMEDWAPTAKDVPQATPLSQTLWNHKNMPVVQKYKNPFWRPNEYNRKMRMSTWNPKQHFHFGKGDYFGKTANERQSIDHIGYRKMRDMN